MRLLLLVVLVTGYGADEWKCADGQLYQKIGVRETYVQDGLKRRCKNLGEL